MKALMIIFLIVFGNITIYSQSNWEMLHITDEFNAGQLRCMYYDEQEDELWIGGLIKSIDSLQNTPYNFLLKYDGTSWEHYGPFYGSNILDITRFQDKIVFCGSWSNYLGMYGNEYDQYKSIAYIQADTVGHFDGMGSTGVVFGLNVIDDELYAYGIFDTICGIAANSIAKFNGTQWSTVYDVPDLEAGGSIAYINCGSKYNDLYYLGGNFSNFDYFGAYGSCIANYNGADWELTGGGIQGGFIGVSELEIFQEELYAAGVIYKNAGNAGNGIQKWNGTNWSSVGDDLRGNGNSLDALLFVNDLEVHNNELYMAGYFEYAGDIPASAIVKWDGEKYCSFGGNFYYGFQALTFMHDTLYAAGGTISLDGVIYENVIAKYIGGNTVVECSTVGIKENDALLQLDIYPSPATNEINIYLPKGNYKNLEVEVYNLLGQKVQYKNSNSLESKKINIQIQNFSKGQYTVLLKEKGVVMGSGRFIKE
jgi:hypothetical protein